MKVLFNYLTTFCIFLLPFHAFSQIKGKVTDQGGNALAFITVFDATYQYHTVSNIEGNYQLDLPLGEHKLFYQYLGYKTRSENISNEGKPIIKNMVLEKESFNLPEVTITSDGEDPAYGIIRKAIRLRSQNRYPVEGYKAEVYGKGLIKMLDAPRKIMGQEVGNMGGMLDSTNQGIIYLTESVTEVSYQKPDYFFEKIIASKVSGDPGGISVNSFARSNFSLYDETTDFSRNMISPIADNALSFYKYKLVTTFTDESGYTVYKIDVKPKYSLSQTYQGELNIVDESYKIHSFDIYTTGNQLRNSIIDTLRLSQLFKPVEKDKWCIITQNIHFGAKLFGFKARGYFNYIFLDYNLNFIPDKKGAEVLVVDKEAGKKDSIFWQQIRPVPLTQIESKDYIKKDSLNKIWNSATYKDSIDRKNNRFKFNKLLFGYNYNKSAKHYSVNINSPINTLQFNAVEGANVQLPVSFIKTDTTDDEKYKVESFLQYGFSDQRLKYGVRTTFHLNKINLTKLTLTYSDRYEQFDETRPVGTFSNTFNSLLYKANFGRYYDRQLVRASFQTELFNGFVPIISVSWDQRRSLVNTTNFSYRRKELSYKPNNIRATEGYQLNDKSFVLDMVMRIRVGQKFMTIPDNKIRMQSKWPSVQLRIQSALPLADQYVSFTKAEINIRKNYMPMQKYGFGKFNFKAGMFLTKDKISDVDLLHIQSNDLWFITWSDNINYFRNVPFYTLSSDKPYASVFYEHNFEGFITDRLPFIRKSNLQLTSNLAAHIRKDVQYGEAGIGLDGLSIGPLKLLKLDYVFSFGFRSQDMAAARFRIVINDIFNMEPGF